MSLLSRPGYKETDAAVGLRGVLASVALVLLVLYRGVGGATIYNSLYILILYYSICNTEILRFFTVLYILYILYIIQVYIVHTCTCVIIYT